jgi:hypothetical protein
VLRSLVRERARPSPLGAYLVRFENRRLGIPRALRHRA